MGRAEHIHTDGDYYSEDVIKNFNGTGIELHFINMTGTTSNAEKLSIADIIIEGNKIVTCPLGESSRLSYYNEGNGKITAHFDIGKCRNCEHYDCCPTREGANSAVIVITSKALIAALVRQAIHQDFKINTTKRAAIEGTNSAFKRCGGNDLRVRTLIKSRMVVGLKIMSRNIRQLWRYTINDFRRNFKSWDISVQNGALALA